MLSTIKKENLNKTVFTLKSQFLTLLFSLILFTCHSAADYEKGMQKVKEMFTNAKSLSELVDVTNYYERIAEINKSEWLPLYYAAYASLRAGAQQENAVSKDEWFEKGLAFIERAHAIKKDESEIYAMEGYLQLMYISNKPMERAPTQTGEAIELLEKAKNLNPSNPRPWFIHGQNTLYTPEFFGGGAGNAKPLLEKASTLYKSFTSDGSFMPVWGKERCENLLKECEGKK